MTSIWCKQFKAPDCGQSARFKLAQVTVDYRLVQQLHHLLMSIGLHQVDFLFIAWNKLLGLRIDSVSAWTASPATLCLAMYQLWHGDMVQDSGKSKISWQDSGFDFSLTTRLTILRSSSAASRSAPAKTKTKFVPSPTLQKTRASEIKKHINNGLLKGNQNHRKYLKLDQ